MKWAGQTKDNKKTDSCPDSLLHIASHKQKEFCKSINIITKADMLNIGDFLQIHPKENEIHTMSLIDFIRGLNLGIRGLNLGKVKCR